MDAHLHARFRARQIGTRCSFALPHISRKCGSRTLVQFGFDSCSLLTNTAKLRLTQDHVLKSLCCYAVPDAIIYWHIADIHSIRTVLIERLATAVTHWPSPRSMICQRVPVDINVQRPNCLNRGRSHETYLHHPYLCDTCTFSAVPPSGAHACGKKECNDG